MAKNITIAGVTFADVPGVFLQTIDGKQIAYIEDPNPGTGIPVAKIGEKEYFTVEKALAEAVSGDTIQMIANSTEIGVVVPEGITLDLNGYTLTVGKHAVGLPGGKIIDNSTSNNGLLVAAMNTVKLDTNNEQLPVWNGEAYLFVKMDKHRLLKETPSTGGYKIVWLAGVEMKAVELFKNGAADNNVQIGILLTWDGGERYYPESEDSIATVYSSNKGTQGSYGKNFAMTITSTDETNLKATILLKSTTGAEVRSPVLQIN